MLALVLIIPLASGLITNVEMPDIEQKLGHEIIISSNGKEWNQSMWDDLQQYGITPLRLLNETELLGWRNDFSVIDLEYFELFNGHDNNWRGGEFELENYPPSPSN